MELLIIQILFGIAMLLTLLLVVSIVVHIWATVPYVPTQQAVLDEAFSMANFEKGDKFYDLGAGDGRVLIQAKKRFPTITAVGYECVPTVWMFGQSYVRWFGRKVDLRYGNFFSKDLSDADVIFTYLFPGVMKKLEKKFERELKPGTRIVSHAFLFADREPDEHRTVQCGRRRRNLYLYVWT